MDIGLVKDTPKVMQILLFPRVWSAIFGIVLCALLGFMGYVYTVRESKSVVDGQLVRVY
jgi:hypothetical protein